MNSMNSKNPTGFIYLLPLLVLLSLMLFLSNRFAYTKGDRSDITKSFSMYRLVYESKNAVPDNWDAHLFGDLIFLRFLNNNTSLKVEEKNKSITFDELPKLLEKERCSFIFQTGESDYTLTDTQIELLRYYLMNGGFLYVDDCVAFNSKDWLFQACKQQMKKVFPELEWQLLGGADDIYHSYYDLDNLPYFTFRGKRQGKYNGGGWAMFYKGRMIVYLTSVDIHCGWCSYQTNWFSEEETNQALKMGTNIIIYRMSQCRLVADNSYD